MSELYAEAMVVIADYALAQGWVPIGFRYFAVGPWDVTVNGTKDERDGIPPFHARIHHKDIVAMMVVNPYGGVKSGWKDTEAMFIRDMRAATPTTGRA